MFELEFTEEELAEFSESVEPKGFQLDLTKKHFSAAECPNEEYHSREGALKDYISGTGLSEIYHKSLAHYQFGDSTETAALHFGIAAHTAFIEPKEFERDFVRGINKDEHENLLGTDAALKSWLKSKGRAGYSTKKRDELVAMVRETMDDGEVVLLDDLLDELKSSGKTIVQWEDYDNIQKMRNVLMANPLTVEHLKGVMIEETFIGEIDGVKVKVRPDMFNPDTLENWDYKTTITAHPDKFPRKAYDLGYYLKMALQHDVICQAMGVSQLRDTVLLAQEKASPFVAKPYSMTEDQLNIGRSQYKTALRLIKKAREKGVYPAYGNKKSAMVTPDYILREWGML